MNTDVRRQIMFSFAQAYDFDPFHMFGKLFYPAHEEPKDRILGINGLGKDEELHRVSLQRFAHSSAFGRESLSTPCGFVRRTSMTAEESWPRGTTWAPASRAMPISGATTGTP